jgi:hypothetical protein
VKIKYSKREYRNSINSPKRVKLRENQEIKINQLIKVADLAVKI